MGDPPHTNEFVESVEDKRKSLLTEQLNEMRHTDCNRFSTEVDSDKVVVDTMAAQEIVAKPKWDAFENNHFAMRRRLVSIFLRVSNKLISRLRAGKRLAKLRNWIESNNIRSREDMKVKVAEDFKLAQNTRLVDDTES